MRIAPRLAALTALQHLQADRRLEAENAGGALRRRLVHREQGIARVAQHHRMQLRRSA